MEENVGKVVPPLHPEGQEEQPKVEDPVKKESVELLQQQKELPENLVEREYKGKETIHKVLEAKDHDPFVFPSSSGKCHSHGPK